MCARSRALVSPMVNVLLGLALAALADVACAQPAEPVRARNVAPDVWLVQGEMAMGSAANRNFISNAAFVITGDGVAVIDALGSPALAESLIAEIRRITPHRAASRRSPSATSS